MANMLNKIMFVSLVCWAVTSLANTNDTIKTYETEGLDALALTSTTQIETLKATSIRTQSEHKSLIDNLMQNAKSGLQGTQKPQAADGAVLFVSFSMPDSLLFALADEAALFNIPVVINGLVEGDFKKTIETFKRLHTEAKNNSLILKGCRLIPSGLLSFKLNQCQPLW